MIKVLFVCLGNICRSPTAAGVLTSRAARRGLGGAFVADSAGTHDWNVGRPPDPRAVAAAARRGVALAHFRARCVQLDDFHRFDHLLAMDRGNLARLVAMRPPDAAASLALLLDGVPGTPVREVPDPYHGGPEDFDRMLDLIEIGVEALLDRLAP